MSLNLAVISYHTSPLAMPGIGDAGGMNVYVRALSGALARSGVFCDIYTRAASPAVPPVVVAEPGVRVFNVEAGPRGPVERNLLPAYVPMFARRVTEVADACRRTYDMIHSHYWLSGEAARHLAPAWRIPFVHTFHTLGIIRNREKALGEMAEPPLRLAGEARVAAAATRLLASTRPEAQVLVEEYGAPEKCLEVIPPGVDHRIFRPQPGVASRLRRRLGLGRRRVVLAAGRVQPLKGFDVAIEALALLPDDVQLVVIGGPSGESGHSEARRLRHLAARHRLGRRVRFLDPIPHEDLADWYRAADVVVVPSRSETFGLVALEAQACGTPVVASDVGGLRDAVEHGTGGLRVPPDDPTSLTAALRSILDDPALRQRLSMGAQRWSHRFLWSSTAARLRLLYTELADVAARLGCGESVSA